MVNSLREAASIQGRVLLALMLREARTRYGRQKAGYLWALVEPILHTSIFYVALTFRLRILPLGDSPFVFLATGFTVYLGFRNVWSRTEGGYASNQSLLAYPIVRLMDVFIGRALLEIATWVAVLCIVFGSIQLLGIGSFPSSIPKMVAAVAALSAIGFGLGVSIGIAAEFLPSVDSVARIPKMMLYWTSGLFFLPDALPPQMRDIIYWNPISHGITLFREGYYYGYHSDTLDINYLIGWALGTMLLAFVLERIARRPIRNIAA